MVMRIIMRDEKEKNKDQYGSRENRNLLRQGAVSSKVHWGGRGTGSLDLITLLASKELS